MSRSYHTRPSWVTTSDRTLGAYVDHDHRFGPCDAPPSPPRPVHPSHRLPLTSCEWVFPRHSARNWWYGCGSPPNDYCHDVWYAPVRSRVRIQCANLTKEFNATGEVTTEIDTWDHRRNATWLWW
jgi:hypothetical protein